jgi:uncharacterized damage-inducible protein DinB
MAETYQQYKKRVLAYLADRDPLDVQRATSVELARLIDGLSSEALTRQPAPGKWSIVEIIAHMADAELAISWRLRIMLSRPDAAMQWFDEDDWARRFNYQAMDVHAALELFRVLRQANIRLLEATPRETWCSARGMHETRGEECVADYVIMEAVHDLNHLRQIEALVTAAQL